MKVHLSSNTSGFTLLEIALAIAILGMGLTTLIALQTQHIDAYQRERNLTIASLYAQYVMSCIEAAQEPPETGSKSGDLKSLLSDYGYFDYEPSGVSVQSSDNLIEDWSYELTVSSQDVPPLEDVLRRVDLSIIWGGQGGDSTTFVYYAFNEEFSRVGSQ